MAPRKCTQARLAGEGAGRGGHSPARPRPGGPREALGPPRRGRGSRYHSRESGPPFAPLPPPPLPRGAPGGRPRGGTRAQAGLGAAPRGGPGPIGPPPGPRRRPAPFPAPRLPTSSWAPRRLLLPSQARGVRRGPATGGTCAPQIRIRETVPAPCWRGGDGCGCAGGALCAGTCSGCVPYKKQNIFYTLKKKMFLPVAWISPGLFLKPSFGWKLPASRDGDKRRPGGPESRGPGLARLPDAARLESGHRSWRSGRAPAAPRLNSMPVTCGVGARFAKGAEDWEGSSPGAPEPLELLSLP